MANTGLRFDITVQDGLFPNENKIINWLCKELVDGAWTEVSDMTGREFTLYVLENPRQPLTEALLTLEWGVGVTAPEAPYIRATFETSTSVVPGRHFYRLRRSDSGNVRTIAYGMFNVVIGDEMSDQIW